MHDINMNEYKSQPVALWFGIAVVAIFVGLMVAAFANGPEIGWTGHKLVAIELGLLSACFLLLLFVRFFEAVLLKIASMKAVRWALSYDKNKQAQGGAASTAESQAQARALREALRSMHGSRWRYRQPWLLLTGNDNLIGRLVPELAESGWRITPDAVLLGGKANADDQTDASWLRQVYKLRRRRPVDAVLLVNDGTKDVTAERRGFHDGIQLTRITDTLRWSAPVYALDVVQSDQVAGSDTPLIACETPRQANAAAISAQLQTLRDQIAQRSLASLPQQGRERYLGQLSQKLDTRSEALANWLGRLISGQHRRPMIRGILFAPCHGPATASSVTELPLWHYVTEAVRRVPGRRTVSHPVTIFTALALIGVALWTAGMLISGLRNEHDLRTAQQAMHDLQSAPDAAARLKALDSLQQQIQRYEYRIQHHAPIFTRFGLNRDEEVLAALWKPYAKASRDILVTPVVQDLEATLGDLSQLQTSGLSDETSKWALEGRNTLKAYLMLAHPERVESTFLAQQLVQHWSTDARITPGQKQDLAERFARFHAEHLKSNPDWRIEARPELVGGARQTLLAVIGERNAVDTIYQHVLDGAGHKYPDQTLASLTVGTDPRGLVRAAAIVPGVFTRQAYEGYVEGAIDKAAKRQDVANDWVLTDGQPQQAPSRTSESAEDLRRTLTERYFADYAEHWQQFMNGMQWEPAATLPGVVDQLKLMADARQSPVIALMKSLEYQGGAGVRKDSLAETLVAKTQGILGRKDDTPDAARPDPAGPLAAAFGPVLRLAGQSGQGGAGNSELSLQRYLDRVTAVRLRLQQITNSADADMQARRIAQSLFQGKGSDLADTHAYAQLMAASLGAEWAGMGDVLFVRPIAQAEQAVLQPAQASLNEAWRQSIALPWNRAFASRYPFANTANDVSLPELARHIRPQSGLINAFLMAELAGVLVLQGDRWVPVGSGTQGLTFDPAFLKFINTLQRVGAHLLVQGGPQYRFELKPIPTPGLTDTLLTIDSQKLHYYNQRETWHAMTWPSNNLQEPRTLLQWQTQTAGTNKNYETEGVWAWVRMLERARVTPVDSAIVQLTFQAVPDSAGTRPGMGNSPPADEADGADSPESLLPRAARLAAPAHMVYPIRYQMRAAVGRGPLEMLELRNLRMPQRIFVGREPQTQARTAPSHRK